METQLEAWVKSIARAEAQQLIKAAGGVYASVMRERFKEQAQRITDLERELAANKVNGD